MIAPVPPDVRATLDEAVLAIEAEHDLDDVLQMIAERARTLVGARFAAVGIPVPGAPRLERFVTAGLTPEQIESIRTTPEGRGLLGVMLRDGRALSVPDIGADPRAAGVPPNHPPMHNLLGVPIKGRGAVLGQLYVADKIARDAFTAQDHALLEALARHAALAVVNARLIGRLTESEQRYRVLTQGAPEIVFATDGDGRISFVNDRAAVVTGFEPEAILGRRLRDLVRAEDRAVVDLHLKALAEGAAHARLAVSAVGRSGETRHFEVSLAPRHAAGSGCLGIALDVTDRRAREREVAERTAELLSTREERERLREFVSLVIQAQEDERARLAGDLHDTVVQTLTALGRRLRALAEAAATPSADLAAELTDMAEAALAEADEMRRLTRSLRPSVLDHLGLAAALQHLAEELRAGGLTVDLVVTGDAARLDDRARTSLFRIAQEALTNVRRHSDARRVDVHLTLAAADARLDITDDGRGFPADASLLHPHAHSERLGLLGMRERAAMLGGTLVIVSAPGAGARVSVTVPLDG